MKCLKFRVLIGKLWTAHVKAGWVAHLTLFCSFELHASLLPPFLQARVKTDRPYSVSQEEQRVSRGLVMGGSRTRTW